MNTNEIIQSGVEEIATTHTNTPEDYQNLCIDITSFAEKLIRGRDEEIVNLARKRFDCGACYTKDLAHTNFCEFLSELTQSK